MRRRDRRWVLAAEDAAGTAKRLDIHLDVAARGDAAQAGDLDEHSQCLVHLERLELERNVVMAVVFASTGHLPVDRCEVDLADEGVERHRIVAEAAGSVWRVDKGPSSVQVVFFDSRQEVLRDRHRCIALADGYLADGVGGN